GVAAGHAGDPLGVARVVDLDLLLDQTRQVLERAVDLVCGADAQLQLVGAGPRRVAPLDRAQHGPTGRVDVLVAGPATQRSKARDLDLVLTGRHVPRQRDAKWHLAGGLNPEVSAGDRRGRRRLDGGEPRAAGVGGGDPRTRPHGPVADAPRGPHAECLAAGAYAEMPLRIDDIQRDRGDVRG